MLAFINGKQRKENPHAPMHFVNYLSMGIELVHLQLSTETI